MFKLVISDDEGKTTVVPLVRDEITIGRKEGNTIRLTERNVSRRHARIHRKVNDYVLEDLASYNGIVVNGARLADAKPVRHGDQILIGDYKLQIVEEAGVQAPAPTPLPPTPSEPIVPLLAAAPAAPPPTLATAPNGGPGPVGLAALNDPFAQPSRPNTDAPPSNTATSSQAVPESIKGMRVVFLAPAGVPAPVMLDKLPMVLGRSEAADIALPFSSISREHAKLFLENDKLMIEDLESANGVQVNGEKTRRSELGPGDMVQLGVVEFRVARRGDSTVVIQKLALEERSRSTRNPVVLITGVLGGGAVLGLLVFVAFRGINQPTTTVIPLNPAPQAAGPTPTPTAAPNVAPTPIQPPANTPEANPTPTTPVAAPPTPVAVPPVAAPPPTPVPAAPVAPVPTAPAIDVGPQQVLAPVAPTPRHSSRPTARPPTTPPATPPATPPSTPTPAAHVTAAPNTPTPAANPTPAASGETPMQQARACMRQADQVERNACVIRSLAGRASGCELGLLATSYRDSGQTANAIRTMQRYNHDCSSGPFVNSFENYITEHHR